MLPTTVLFLIAVPLIAFLGWMLWRRLSSDRLHEIEYDDELATGGAVGDATVLRLRCFSQTFEFVLPAGTVPQWKSFLPPHRMSAATA